MKTTIISLFALTAIALSGCSDDRGHARITNNYISSHEGGWYGGYGHGWFARDYGFGRGEGRGFFRGRGEGFFGRHELRGFGGFRREGRR